MRTAIKAILRRKTTRLRPRWVSKAALSVAAGVAGVAGVLALASLGGFTAFAKSKKAVSDAEVDKTASVTGEKKTELVRITIQTVPPRKAMVKWGRKSLGMIPVPHPLVVERPRDSGPLDLVIRASGYLPVHTRAYTFSDSRVAVKLTPPEEKNKLFGYREEPAPSPDAGVPAPTSTPPMPAPSLPVAPTVPMP
jgi:hypothetical protein